MDIRELRLAALDRALDNREGFGSVTSQESTEDTLKRASQYMNFIESGDASEKSETVAGAIVKFPNGAAIEAHRIAAIRPARAHEVHGVDYPPMVFVEACDREPRVYLFTMIKVATDEEAERLSRELVEQWKAGLKSESEA